MINNKVNLRSIMSSALILLFTALYSQFATSSQLSGGASLEVGTWYDSDSNASIVAKITDTVEDDPTIKCTYSTCYSGWWNALWEINGYKCNEICTVTPNIKVVYTLDLKFTAENITRFDAERVSFSGKVKAHKKHNNGWIEFRYSNVLVEQMKTYNSGGTYQRKDSKRNVTIWVKEHSLGKKLEFVIDLQENSNSKTKPGSYNGGITHWYILK